MRISRMIVWFICLSWSAWIIGCSHSNDTGGRPEKTKTCFNCAGAGQIPCPNGKDGQMDCPGPCLKLSQGLWEHMTVEGHPATDVWRKFVKAHVGWQAWNQNHVGDVIEYQNGTPVDTGKCKICGGTGKVKCSLCNGTGVLVCPICDGKKTVPESWTVFDNPKMKSRPEQFRLKDGRVLVGKTLMVLGNSVTIRTETTNITVKQSDILAEEKPQK